MEAVYFDRLQCTSKEGCKFLKDTNVLLYQGKNNNQYVTLKITASFKKVFILRSQSRLMRKFNICWRSLRKIKLCDPQECTLIRHWMALGKHIHTHYCIYSSTSNVYVATTLRNDLRRPHLDSVYFYSNVDYYPSLSQRFLLWRFSFQTFFPCIVNIIFFSRSVTLNRMRNRSLFGVSGLWFLLSCTTAASGKKSLQNFKILDMF